MGGDLNLKKSWHPVLMSNQRRVWEEEKKALDERKRTEQRVKELKEERAKEEIQAKLEAAGSRKRIDRVDWMYQGPSSGQAGTTEEMEGYLLGKRRIDGLIKGTEHKNLEKQASQDSFMARQNANTLRDTASKIRDDPMLAIKRQEQAAYEAMMNDPIKRRQLLAIAGKGEEPRVKKERKHRRHHHRHRDDSDDERRHKRRRRDDDERGHRSSRSEHRRRRSDSYSRSPSPVRRRDSFDKPRRRSASPEDRERVTQSKELPRRRRNSSSEDSRSPSPDRRRRSPDRRKSYPDSGRDRKDNGNGGYDNRRNGNGYGRRDDRLPPANAKQPSEEFEAERQRKLAAMQQDASSLDLDRERRLAALAEQEKAAREADDKARARSSKYGNNGEFVNALHRKAGEMALDDRIGGRR
ncbi:Pre-mRNA-splicing factor CWC25 [Hyphodiscus hymeniophilus]|uniref:Pre-mRNA-splicing factor CWC25 n=1 Tax=Hyphodiscus hymeniophilus TaxID=353542 RepID=A0A9P6VMF1_9HELO|nr:Pre-mRNA-splicing factor CWC25 [Hyphodiscus hymeniophilus]